MKISKYLIKILYRLRLNIVLTIILLLSLVLLVSCNEKTNISSNNKADTNLKPYKIMGKEVLSPVDIPYVVENPIEFNRIEVSDNDKYQHNYFEISGLIDKKVEEDINKKIKSLFEEMLPYAMGDKTPPYRGMKSVVNYDGKIVHSSLSFTPNFNYNSVLSIEAQLHGIYYINNENIDFSMIENLNFDLNTGNNFFIEDVFTNDIDGLEIVSNAIMNELDLRRLDIRIDSDEFSNLTLIAPFNGISHNQKFYLTPDGIKVIIDYNNPEFNTGFSNTIVEVPIYSYDSYIGITERFRNEENSIFINDPTKKQFLRHFLIESNHKYEYFDFNGVRWNIFIDYPKEIHKVFTEIYETIKINQKEKFINLSKDIPPQYINQDIYAYRIGQYLNIHSRLNPIIDNKGKCTEESYVYSETGKLINLEDLFVETYDYKNLIINYIKEHFVDYPVSNFLETKFFLNNISFNVNYNNISFIIKPNNWYTGNEIPIYFSITYEKIGYENLKIFD